jgi:hypothetical protein
MEFPLTNQFLTTPEELWTMTSKDKREKGKNEIKSNQIGDQKTTTITPTWKRIPQGSKDDLGIHVQQ